MRKPFSLALGKDVSWRSLAPGDLVTCRGSHAWRPDRELIDDPLTLGSKPLIVISVVFERVVSHEYANVTVLSRHGLLALVGVVVEKGEDDE